MRQIVLSTVAVALIAASASQALAAEALAAGAQSRPHVRKDSAVSDQTRKARDAVNPPSQPAWQYPGWSAPAGR